MDSLIQLQNLVGGSLQTYSILMTCCEPDSLGQKMIASGSTAKGGYCE
ncbi:MAG: hypothetical protein O6761_06430 [Thaumarchaeota archaeon]|nr:hypothetical protein [Nitrososphaerota archaeon]